MSKPILRLVNIASCDQSVDIKTEILLVNATTKCSRAFEPSDRFEFLARQGKRVKAMAIYIFATRE